MTRPKPLYWTRPPCRPATLASVSISWRSAKVLGVSLWISGPPRGLLEKPIAPARQYASTISTIAASSSDVAPRLAHAPAHPALEARPAAPPRRARAVHDGRVADHQVVGHAFLLVYLLVGGAALGRAPSGLLSQLLAHQLRAQRQRAQLG